ncbi:unnamed protein product, partial [Laminaria digitata]
MDAERTAVEDADSDKSDAVDEEALLDASPLERTRDLTRDGVLPQGDDEVLAQTPVIGELVHGEALTPSREGDGAVSGADASSSGEGPGEGELEKGRASGVATAETERDCDSHSSDDDAADDGGGGGGDGGVGGMEEEEEEEEAGSDLERDFGGILQERRRHSATSADA